MARLGSTQYSRREMLRMMGAGSTMIALAACGGAAQPQAAPAAGDGGEAAAPAEAAKVLRIQGNIEEEQPILDLFSAAYPDIQVEVLNVTGIDHEEVASKILSMVAAGQPLDLGYAATEAIQLYAGQGLSRPLDEYVQRDAEELKEYFADVHPSLVEAMMYEGGLYALPFDFNAANMYYSVQLFEEAGYGHPDPDWTKDDFYEIAKAITKKTDSGQTDTFGYAWTNRLWGSWMPWIFVNGGNLLTEERAPGGEWLWEGFYADDAAAEGRGGGWRWMAPNANSASNVEALEFMVQLTQEGVAPAIELGGGGTLQGFFTSNKLGMTPAGGFWAGGLSNAGMAKGTFDVQLFPKWQSQRHQFGTASQFIFKQSAAQDLGWQYLKHRISKPAMEAHGVFTPKVLTTPTRRSMLTEERFAETGPAHWQVFYETLDGHPDTAPIPAPPVSNPMTTLFTSYTARAMNAEMTAQAALDALQKELEDLYARNPDMYPAES